MPSRQEWLETPEKYISRLHPDVQAEYEAKAASNPGLCNYPYGPVMPSASKPRPQWCVLKLGHGSNHANQAQVERRQAQVREAVQRFRSKEESE